MKCPLCNREINEGLLGKYSVFQPSIGGTEEGGSVQICGRCYLLVRIKDILEEMKDDYNRRS